MDGAIVGGGESSWFISQKSVVVVTVKWNPSIRKAKVTITRDGGETSETVTGVGRKAFAK